MSIRPSLSKSAALTSELALPDRVILAANEIEPDVDVFRNISIPLLDELTISNKPSELMSFTRIEVAVPVVVKERADPKLLVLIVAPVAIKFL